MALDIPDPTRGSPGHLSDHEEIVDEVNRIGALVDGQPAPVVAVSGGQVSLDLPASAWVVATDGTPYYDPDVTVAGRRGQLQISPIDGGYVVAAP